MKHYSKMGTLELRLYAYEQHEKQTELLRQTYWTLRLSPSTIVKVPDGWSLPRWQAALKSFQSKVEDMTD